MLSFSIPAVDSGRQFFVNFHITGHNVLFAGSRHIDLEPQVCSDLISMFASLGGSFFVGCANGVDRSFRKAFAIGEHRDKVFCACAFNSKVGDCYGLEAGKVVKDGLPPAAALSQRTIWMCSHANTAVLFPSLPIGRGSALVFRQMIQANKPLFIAGDAPPESAPDLYRYFKTSLFGVVSGYWVLPHNSPSKNKTKLRRL